MLDDDDDETHLQASEQNKTASDMTRTTLGCEQAGQADNIGSPAEQDQNKENLRENVRVVGATTTQRIAEARAGSQDHDQNFNKTMGKTDILNEPMKNKEANLNKPMKNQDRKSNQRIKNK